MSVNERKINFINTPIELVVDLLSDMSNDYVPMDNYMNTWAGDISENKIFNYENHKDIIKYLIFKTVEVIDKYLSFFMCIPVKINPWIVFMAITPLCKNPLEESPILIENFHYYSDTFLGIDYSEECPTQAIQPKLLKEWYNQALFENSTPICIKFKYLNNDFFFRIKYSMTTPFMERLLKGWCEPWFPQKVS